MAARFSFLTLLACALATSACGKFEVEAGAPLDANLSATKEAGVSPTNDAGADGPTDGGMTDAGPSCDTELDLLGNPATLFIDEGALVTNGQLTAVIANDAGLNADGYRQSGVFYSIGRAVGSNESVRVTAQFTLTAGSPSQGASAIGCWTTARQALWVASRGTTTGYQADVWTAGSAQVLGDVAGPSPSVPTTFLFELGQQDTATKKTKIRVQWGSNQAFAGSYKQNGANTTLPDGVFCGVSYLGSANGSVRGGVTTAMSNVKLCITAGN